MYQKTSLSPRGIKMTGTAAHQPKVATSDRASCYSTFEEAVPDKYSERYEVWSVENEEVAKHILSPCLRVDIPKPERVRADAYRTSRLEG